MSDDAPELPGLPARAFAKIDSEPDERFYEMPRFVTHIDEAAVAAVTGLYRELFAPGATVLDLMGSWVSHLPPEVAYGHVIGHGMNAEELAGNPRYDRWFVHNLNAEPHLPLDPASVDAIGLCVSIQYLQRPVAVMRDALRVLRPQGLIAITFSNRCFPTKAVAIWQSIAMGDHTGLVSLYLQQAGFCSVEARTLIPLGGPSDPLWAVIGRKTA